MNLNDLFKAKGISPEDVLVFRHRPRERELNKVLPWLASEKPELFNAYQQTQGPRTENAMLGAKYVASFIGNEPGKALFIGLYKIGKTTPITKKQFWKKPVHIALKKHGLYGFTGGAPSDTVLWFDLTLTDFYADWKGKLIVKWPPPELSWYRRAHRNEIPVFSILGESVLDKGMPNWDEITLTWDELQILPASWKAKLSEWRAIYYIYDTSIRKGYVGSAYGATNLLSTSPRKWGNSL